MGDLNKLISLIIIEEKVPLHTMRKYLRLSGYSVATITRSNQSGVDWGKRNKG